MKYALIALLVVYNPISTSAQKHNLYADEGICGSRLDPGLSATYNYRFIKRLGVGIGAQLYDIFPGVSYTNWYVPAVFGDLRFNIRPRKKNQFFLFADVGINLFKHSGGTYTQDSVIYTDNKNNATYTGYGLGYFCRLTQYGGGIYTSLKLISSGYKADAYDIVSGKKYVEPSSRGTFVLSFGFKFSDMSTKIIPAQKKHVVAKPKEKKEKVTTYHEPIPTLKHSIYADVGIPFPGFSVTYNYKLAKHFGAGIGVQGYKMYHSPAHAPTFTPTVFGEIRLNIRPEKNNRFFLFLDLGMDFYKQDKTYRLDSTGVYNVPHNNGFYSGLGFGYFHRITKNGGGPYVSFKFMFNWYQIKEYSIVSEQQDRGVVSAVGDDFLSIGFKF